MYTYMCIRTSQRCRSKQDSNYYVDWLIIIENVHCEVLQHHKKDAVYVNKIIYIHVFVHITIHPSACTYIHTYILVHTYIHTYIHCAVLCSHKPKIHTYRHTCVYKRLHVAARCILYTNKCVDHFRLHVQMQLIKLYIHVHMLHIYTKCTFSLAHTLAHTGYNM